MFSRVIIACVVGVASAQLCPQPKAEGLGHQYLCDNEYERHGAGGAWNAWSTSMWEGAPPGVLQDSNVVLGDKDGVVSLTVHDNGNDWQPPKVNATDDSQCKCNLHRIGTSMIATTKRYGYGFYEAKIRTQPAQVVRANGNTASAPAPTQFHGSFWLQGERAEIDVIEFVDRMLVEDGTTKSEYTNNVLCFDPTDTTGESTVEQPETVDTTTYFNRLGSSLYHTYGVEWQQDTVKFFINGKLIRTASAACLVGDTMNIVIGHETNMEYGGYNDPGNWDKDAYQSTFADETLNVQSFTYWKTTYLSSKKTTSSKSCGDLGWTNAVDGVCSSSKIDLTAAQADAWGAWPGVADNTAFPNNFCGHVAGTRAQAEEICSTVGARMCSARDINLQHDVSQSLCKKKRSKFTPPAKTAYFHTYDLPVDNACHLKFPQSLKKVIANDTLSYNTLSKRSGGVLCDHEGARTALIACCADAKDWMPGSEACTDQAAAPAAFSAVTTATGKDGKAYSFCVREDFGISRSASYVGIPRPTCKTGSHQEAEAYCAREGGRLCTLDEVKIDRLTTNKKKKGELVTLEAVFEGASAAALATNFLTKENDTTTNGGSTLCHGTGHDIRSMWLSGTNTDGTLTCGAQSKASAPEIKKRGYVSKYNWRKKSFKKQFSCRSKSVVSNIVCCYNI